jgi:hypothetical protein
MKEVEWACHDRGCIQYRSTGSGNPQLSCAGGGWRTHRKLAEAE